RSMSETTEIELLEVHSQIRHSIDAFDSGRIFSQKLRGGKIFRVWKIVRVEIPSLFGACVLAGFNGLLSNSQISLHANVDQTNTVRRCFCSLEVDQRQIAQSRAKLVCRFSYRVTVLHYHLAILIILLAKPIHCRRRRAYLVELIYQRLDNFESAGRVKS